MLANRGDHPLAVSVTTRSAARRRGACVLCVYSADIYLNSDLLPYLRADLIREDIFFDSLTHQFKEML